MPLFNIVLTTTTSQTTTSTENTRTSQTTTSTEIPPPRTNQTTTIFTTTTKSQIATVENISVITITGNRHCFSLFIETVTYLGEKNLAYDKRCPDLENITRNSVLRT